MSLVYALGMGILVLAVPVAFVARRTSALLVALGCGALVAIGAAAAVAGSRPVLDLGTWLGLGASHLRIDGLAGIFLALLGLTGAAVSLAYAERPSGRGLGPLHALVVLATATVIGADHAFLFLLAWEGLTLTVYLLASADRDDPAALVAGYFTGGLTKVGGAALLAGFGLMYGHTHSFLLADWAHAAAGLPAGTRGVAFVLFLAAFGTKVGVLPLQGAVPVGYRAAPALGAATLSLALVAGFYGIWRLVFDVLGPAELWWGELVLALGALTAFGGILYATAQDDVRRFLGFSTIEHTGIALLGLGTALVGSAIGEPKLAAAGLLAGTLHLVAHAIAKTLAFLAAERVRSATGEDTMAPLGGLARTLPRTASGFGVAVLTLAAMPPLAGFVSEWFTFEALLQGFRVEHTLARLLMALAAATLALTAGVGLLAFAKLYGFVFLGRARSPLGAIREPGGFGLGIALLGTVALGLGAAAPWEIHLLGSGLTATLGLDPASTAITHPLVLGPVYSDFAVLAPTWLAIVLPVYALAAAAFVVVRRRPAARRAPVWVTGSAARIADVQYRPAAYVNPIRVVLGGLYGFRSDLRDPGDASPAHTLRLERRVVLAVDRFLYRPLAAAALLAAAQIRRLQSGRLSAYLLYMLVVLLVVLALIPTLH